MAESMKESPHPGIKFLPTPVQWVFGLCATPQTPAKALHQHHCHRPSQRHTLCSGYRTFPREQCRGRLSCQEGRNHSSPQLPGPCIPALRPEFDLLCGCGMCVLGYRNSSAPGTLQALPLLHPDTSPAHRLQGHQAGAGEGSVPHCPPAQPSQSRAR